MFKSSGASFPGFGSEEIYNLQATETVAGTVELPQTAETQVPPGTNEVLSRQVNTTAPSLGDSQADQASVTASSPASTCPWFLLSSPL